MAYPYPQPPAPRARPTIVTVSSYLLYLVAAVQLVAAVIGLSVIGATSRVIDDNYSGTFSSSAKTVVVGGAVFGAVIEILFAAGLAILAIFNNRGKQGSRITTWVIGGIALCCNGFGVLGNGSTFESNFNSDTGGPSSAELQRDLTDALPSWHTAVTVTLSVLSLLALLAVIILLALPASNSFFRKLGPTGGWDPSLQYGGANPYGAQSPYPQAPYPGQPYPGQPYPGQPYPGQPYPQAPYPGQAPYAGQPYPGQPTSGQAGSGQQFPGQPVYPGQEPSTPPPASAPPTGGSHLPPAEPRPGEPGHGQPGHGQPGQGQPGQGESRPDEQNPHTGSIPPTDPWNAPPGDERPPSDPTTSA